MDTMITLLSAAGLGGVIGSVMTSLLQAWLSRKASLDERKFREKKEAYAGLLNAIYQTAHERSQVSIKEAGYWRARCDLVGSEKVRDLTKHLFDLADGTPNPGIPVAESALLAAMRVDLGIALTETS